MQTFMQTGNPAAPSSDAMLEAMMRENEQLRSRLVDTERDYVRISRLNEIYREELIDHRRRVRNIEIRLTDAFLIFSISLDYLWIIL